MSEWQTVCDIEEIPLNGGCCALLRNQQVAVFRVQQGADQKLYAIDNFDPFSDANVISRGIVGSSKGRVVVASPIYKQHFCLGSGECLEDNVTLRTWDVRLSGHKVQVAI